MTEQNTQNSETLMNYAVALQIILLITLLFVPFTPTATRSLTPPPVILFITILRQTPGNLVC